MGGVARSSVYFARKMLDRTDAARPALGPRGDCSDAQLIERIRLVLAATALLGEGYRKFGRSGASAAYARAVRGCCD
jgi:hypothetical protein